MPIRFEVGQTYVGSNWGDEGEYVYSFTILARTEKTITTNIDGRDCKRRPYLERDVEQFRPFGTYANCIIISADETLERRNAHAYQTKI
jgi:hypothetical protein